MSNTPNHPNTITTLLRDDKARTEGMTFLFQPIINSNTNSEWGSEILTRWFHPKTGQIPPEKLMKFIGSARLDCVFLKMQLDRILEESRKVNKTGCQEYFFVTINLSRRFIDNEQIIKTLTECSKKLHSKKIKITIELYEGNSYNTPSITRNILKLQEKGIKVALDDFGARRSNIESLISTPIDIVKIDKSIVQKISTSHICPRILSSLLCICREMKLEAIAEGVENSDQYELLKNIGFELFQGYYFSAPRPKLFQ
ncbi:EAL domain-containing protein [Pseudomonas aeruginosa]|uniref:EAL domain-containing protein n=1 Tax=Pseudomonas aeruginosa TaxID=287 RepID=UPI00163CE7AF|nr:EAL domain-containing protein [Pseudomonas aeruginosa]MBI7468844.1 EAL domain-containing protein [Pseudomonas aeruginosa]